MPFLNNIKDDLKTKFYIILIAFFYVFGLFGIFCGHKIIFSFLAFILVCLFTLFIDFDFKRSIILFLIFILGIIRADNVYDFKDDLENIISKDVTIVGKVITSKNISTKTNKIKFFVECKEAKINNSQLNNVKSKVLVVSDYVDSFDNLIIGDTIFIKGKLKPPKDKTNPYQFDYKSYLMFKDCKNILYGDFNSFKILNSPNFKSDPWFHTLRYFELTRNKIIEKHSKNIKSPKLEILAGIVFGNETINPDDKIKENFKNSGLLHLLAASGLNVALIYGIWYKIASLLRLPIHLSIILGIVFIILYTFMTGFPPSILRASTMLLFVLFGKLINRDANSISLIFFVGFLILLFNPKMIYDVGFELSFMVTIGLIVCCPVVINKFKEKEEKFKEKYSNLPKLKRNLMYLFSPISLVSIVLVPLVAQLWVIPLQMHYFNNITPFSILANIAVVPFIGLLSFIGFISSIIALIPYLSNLFVFIFDFIANPMLSILIKISSFFASFKYSIISIMGMKAIQMFGFWAILLILTLNIKNSFKNRKQVIVLIILTILFSLSFVKFNNHNFEINMFDVDNADCFLIKTPNNKYIMIDTGKSNFKGLSNAKTIVTPFIKNERIDKLETLIITHFDIDHAGGTIEILDLIPTKNVILQKENDNSKISKEIIKYLKTNKIPYKIAKNNETIYKENSLEIKTFKSNLNSDNEDSIVTLINYNNKNILFMADMGVVGFDKIKNYLPDKIDILKIGHHGAKNTIDDNMINKLNPSYALISAGIGSVYHPHFETTTILDKYQIKTITTKNYGFSKVIIDNNDFKFIHYENSKFKKVLFDRFDEIPIFKQDWFLKNFSN